MPRKFTPHAIKTWGFEFLKRQKTKTNTLSNTIGRALLLLFSIIQREDFDIQQKPIE
jgi:hypothetical protein